MDTFIRTLSYSVIFFVVFLIFSSPLFSDESKDKRIKELEILLQSYIVENNNLKDRIEKLENYIITKTEVILQSSSENDVSSTSCIQDPSRCDTIQLCKLASYNSGYKKVWRNDSWHQKYVLAAKSRNVNCGVKDEKDVVTNLPSCEDNINQCSMIQLCKRSTYKFGETVNWSKNPNDQNFIDVAKSKGFDCGVKDEKDVVTNLPSSQDKISSKSKEVTKIKTAQERCDANISGCNKTDLCKIATLKDGLGDILWKTKTSQLKYVKEAKRRNLDCSVKKQETYLGPITDWPEWPKNGWSWPEEWTHITNNSVGDTYYIDFGRIEKKDGYISFWVLGDLLELMYSGDDVYYSHITFQQADCKLQKIRKKKVRFYKRPKGEGSFLGGPHTNKWSYPEPNSVPKAILNAVCKK